MPQNRVGTAMTDVHNRLVAKNYLKGLSKSEFANEAGEFLGISTSPILSAMATGVRNSNT